MLNTKFIKIIILIAIPLILIFAFIFIKNNNSATNTQEVSNSTSTLTGANGRPILNTDLSNPTPVEQQDSTNTQVTYSNTNVNPSDYANSGPEDLLRKKIEGILFNWNITKDEKSLREAVALSENIDNEVVLSAWTPFMKTDSAELIKIINTSTDIKKTKKIIKNIFQWYIDLSGEYEKLPSAKKQQITSQYNQMK